MKTILFQRSAILLLAFTVCLPLAAEDWPQWLGPDGSNQTSGKDFLPDLNKYNIAWEKQIGLGYASITVADGNAFAMGHDQQGKETIYCLEASTGKEKWRKSYDAELIPRMHKGGPNASPTIDGDRVFTLSKDGRLYSLNVQDGSVNWEANLVDIFGIKIPSWGFASSPVLHDGRIIVSAGKVASLDASNGKALWVSQETYRPGYTTPVIFENGATEFVATMDGKGLSILTARGGVEIARHPFKAQFDMQATTPIILKAGSQIFISGNMTSELLAFDGTNLTGMWKTREIKNAMNNSVIADGVIYGVDGKQGSRNSRLVAVSLDSGKLIWSREGFGFGNTIGVGEHILSLSESGELAVSGMNKIAFKEFSRRKILGSTCWTTPIFADQRIYVRNDLGHLICLSKS
ncbi:PQQ-like beta-propeller repeat protein [bacterium]|nr:PQQ-like beta-propeller repeat protein [bacterium]MDB4705597.1 PQQ-like beta-propeller repeat protein [Verrucomicrobiota bacterium]